MFFSQGILITRFQILLRLKLRTNNMRRGKYFEVKNVNTMEHKISWICVNVNQLRVKSLTTTVIKLPQSTWVVKLRLSELGEKACPFERGRREMEQLLDFFWGGGGVQHKGRLFDLKNKIILPINRSGLWLQNRSWLKKIKLEVWMHRSGPQFFAVG